MASAPLRIDLPSPEATDGFAGALAPHLRAGDVLLLEGRVGAGKTAFARALIGALRSRAGLPPEDVPSPTFTLVQSYDTGSFETWHADLYRLRNSGEVAELGLEEAFERALCLVEWPDRLGHAAPEDAARLHFAPAGPADGRTLSIDARGDLRWRIMQACTGQIA